MAGREVVEGGGPLGGLEGAGGVAEGVRPSVGPWLVTSRILPARVSRTQARGEREQELGGSGCPASSGPGSSSSPVGSRRASSPSLSPPDVLGWQKPSKVARRRSPGGGGAVLAAEEAHTGIPFSVLLSVGDCGEGGGSVKEGAVDVQMVEVAGGSLKRARSPGEAGPLESPVPVMAVLGSVVEGCGSPSAPGVAAPGLVSPLLGGGGEGGFRVAAESEGGRLGVLGGGSGGGEGKGLLFVDGGAGVVSPGRGGRVRRDCVKGMGSLGGGEVLSGQGKGVGAACVGVGGEAVSAVVGLGSPESSSGGGKGGSLIGGHDAVAKLLKVALLGGELEGSKSSEDEV